MTGYEVSAIVVFLVLLCMLYIPGLIQEKADGMVWSVSRSDRFWKVIFGPLVLVLIHALLNVHPVSSRVLIGTGVFGVIVAVVTRIRALSMPGSKAGQKRDVLFLSIGLPILAGLMVPILVIVACAGSTADHWLLGVLLLSGLFSIWTDRETGRSEQPEFALYYGAFERLIDAMSEQLVRVTTSVIEFGKVCPRKWQPHIGKSDLAVKIRWIIDAMERFIIVAVKQLERLGEGNG